MKKTTLKRLICVLAALVMLGSVFAACAGNGGNDKQTKETEQKEHPYMQDDGLPDKKYDGDTVTYLTATEITGGELTVMDIEDSDDPLLTSLYRRTKYVEDRFNVDVVDNRRPYTLTYETIWTGVNSNDGSFDACYGFIAYMFPLALEGCFIEFNEVPYIDVTREWWDQNAREAFTVANKLFYLTGDANMFYNDYTWVLFFNKDIMKDIQEDAPYDSVRKGTWTLDKMYNMGLKARYDVNGDSVYDKAEDRFGMVTHQYTANALLYGSNELFFEKDENDEPFITFENSRVIDVCEKVEKFFKTAGYMYDTTNGNGNGMGIQEKFAADEALFAGEVLQCARRYRGMTTDFGILPYPKYDEEQKNYVTYSLEMVYPVGITKNMVGADLERVGIVTEALQSASINSLYKAYFDAALTSARFLRDDESEEMLKIIFETRCFPLATMKDFGGVAGKFAYAVRKATGGYSSLVARFKSMAEGEIQETLEAIDKIK